MPFSLDILELFEARVAPGYAMLNTLDIALRNGYNRNNTLYKYPGYGNEANKQRMDIFPVDIWKMYAKMTLYFWAGSVLRRVLVAQ